MLKVNVGLSHKLSRDYNSTGFSINLEGEIPFSINEPDSVLDHIGEFYDLADKALAQQIEHHQNPTLTLFDAPAVSGPPAPTQEECPSVISFPPPNSDFRATAKQMKYLGDLSQKLSLTTEALDAKVAEILGQPKSHQQLSRREAGTVIAALVGNGDAGGRGARPHPNHQENPVSENPLPFGLHDLAFEHYESPHPPRRVRCYVKGCEELLGPPSRKEPGDICPEHKIRCHLGSNYRTYSYASILDNIIAGLDDFAQKLRSHPFKFESNCRRFGYENSEDCLTWNVFYSFFQARRLHLLANYVTGLDLPDEPECFLWGISLSTFKAWDLLIRARLRYETTDHSSPQPVTDKLPVRRVATEPDAALFLPGKYLILFEAKFGSPNTSYQAGPRKTPCDLCKNELIEIYQDRSLQILDVERANAAERVFYQLWRGMTFAETMALYDSPVTRAYQVNLTRMWMENKSCDEFRQLVRSNYKDRFRHITWEEIHTLAGLDAKLSRLRCYMQQKTLKLQQAFLLGRMFRKGQPESDQGTVP